MQGSDGDSRVGDEGLSVRMNRRIAARTIGTNISVAGLVSVTSLLNLEAESRLHHL